MSDATRMDADRRLKKVLELVSKINERQHQPNVPTRLVDFNSQETQVEGRLLRNFTIEFQNASAQMGNGSASFQTQLRKCRIYY